MKSLIPENSDIFEKSDRIMDSLKYKEYFKDKYLTKSMYKILGMLGEYNSRFNFYTGEPRPNYVESFYSDENELAEYFERCIRDYKNESRLDFEYKKIELNGHIRFESVILSKIINSFYMEIDGTTTLDVKIFNKAPQEFKLNYIESAYKRFGDKNLINMSNANLKIKTLGIILEELGCTDIITYYSPSIPSRVTVFFMPNRQVKDRLKIEQILTKKDILPELEAEKEWEKELKEMAVRSISFDVSQLYYEPTNSNWNIKYRGPSDSHIKISIYNIHGKRIAIILNEMYNPEKHDYFPWDTKSYTSGIYFFKLEVDGSVQVNKLVKIALLK